MPVDPAKSRAATLRKLVPYIRDRFKDGILTRPQLLTACEAVSVPCSHWLTQGNPATDASGAVIRGKYNLSSYYTLDLAALDPESDAAADALESEVMDTRTDSEVETDVRSRFASLDTLAQGVITGAFRALILSGPPGCGKSYRLEQMLERERNLKYERVSGFSRATGLYRLLWEHREDSSVLLVDDCDSVFNDETALSLLKSACDSSRTRHVAWRSESTMVDDDGEPLPRGFEFRGRFIFVTNMDFEARANSDRGLAPHLQALLSRSYYVDLGLTQRELLSRVMDVSGEILKGMPKAHAERILSYIREQAGIMRELSLRTVVKARQIWEQSKDEATFRRIADLTLVSRRLK